MITDLRSALDFLQTRSELKVVSDPIDQYLDVAKIFRSSAGAPAPGPTHPGAPVLFEHVKPSGRPLAMGVFNSRESIAAMLQIEPADLSVRLVDAANLPISPRVGTSRRTSVGPDLTQIPILTITEHDAGPYITMGLVVAHNPDTGARNASVHRLCVQSPDRLTIWIVPGRDLENILKAARRRGEKLPVAIHIGLDPSIYIAAAMTGTLSPPNSDELGIAGSLRGGPIDLCAGSTINFPVISKADWIIEGELSDESIPENPHDFGGFSMPEFLGYRGTARPSVPAVRVLDITTNSFPIAQAVIGPGSEQSNVLGISQEANLLHCYRLAGLDVSCIYCSPAGGGQLLAFIGCSVPDGESRERLVDASLDILRTQRMLKLIVLVDTDVDVMSHTEAWWSFTTRMQPDRDIWIISDTEGFPADPTQHPEYSSSISEAGRTSKMLVDCTVDPDLRTRFERSQL